jgi:hypothetical protein
VAFAGERDILLLYVSGVVRRGPSTLVVPPAALTARRNRYAALLS